MSKIFWCRTSIQTELHLGVASGHKSPGGLKEHPQCTAKHQKNSKTFQLFEIYYLRIDVKDITLHVHPPPESAPSAGDLFRPIHSQEVNKFNSDTEALLIFCNWAHGIVWWSDQYAGRKSLNLTAEWELYHIWKLSAGWIHHEICCGLGNDKTRRRILPTPQGQTPRKQKIGKFFMT